MFANFVNFLAVVYCAFPTLIMRFEHCALQTEWLVISYSVASVMLNVSRLDKLFMVKVTLPPINLESANYFQHSVMLFLV